MKKLAPLILVALIAPQLAFAAWWNPFSWFNNWTFDSKPNPETQALENRVKELEQKINDMASSTTPVTTASTTIATTTATTTKPAEEKKVATTPAPTPKPKVVETTPKPAPAPVVTPTVETSKLKEEPQTFTMPNGAVVDAQGNIISPAGNPAPNKSDIKVGQEVLSSADIYAAIAPSVVLVKTPYAGGTGFVIDNGRYILTNAHVIELANGSHAQFVTLTLHNGTTYKAAVLGWSMSPDLAIISTGVYTPPSVTLGESDTNSLPDGSDVYAIGFPLTLTNTVTMTRGVLSARQNNESTNNQLMLQTDAAIHHGNSGGPLVNDRGEVVGIGTLGYIDPSTGELAPGIGFALPIDVVKNWIPTLTANGTKLFDVYRLGSIITIKRSMLYKMGLNDNLSCSLLGFKGDDLTICNVYSSYRDDFQWTINEDMQF